MYNDTETNYDKFDITDYNQKFIKLIVVSKKETIKCLIDYLIELYNKISVHELKILEDYSDLKSCQ